MVLLFIPIADGWKYTKKCRKDIIVDIGNETLALGLHLCLFSYITVLAKNSDVKISEIFISHFGQSSDKNFGHFAETFLTLKGKFMHELDWNNIWENDI